MSYILDSLKKSEQQRQEQQGEVPDLTTVHGPPVKKRPVWGWLVLGGMVLNALILILLLGPWETDDTTPGGRSNLVAETASVPTTADISVPASTSSLPPEALQGNDPGGSLGGGSEADPAVELGGGKQDVSRKDAQGKTKLYLPAELPADLARRLAPLDITLHYFAQDPARRMVRINGRNLHQGDALQPGIRILEINPDGVVLDANSYRLWLKKP